MPMTEIQAQALKAWRDNDEVYQKGADSLGISRQAFTRNVKAALRWEEAYPGLVKSVDRTELDLTRVDHGWRIIQETLPDGSIVRNSMHYRNDDNSSDPFNLVEAIKDAMADIGPAIPLPQPAVFNQDLISIFPVADLHIGLLTDEEEVGVDWDTKRALKVFEDTFGKLVANTPASQTAILGQLGDLTHTDDQMNVTPQSKHQLDVDSRYFMIVRRAVAVMKWGIDCLRQKYPNVIYRGCRGNHDMTTHIAVTLCLAEHYKNVPEVLIIDNASEFYAHQFGKNMFFFHHGDKAKPERLLPFIANEYSEMWGNTVHRVTFSGHVHHEWTKEMAGMLFRSVGTIIPRDVHAFTHAYGSNRCLMSLTYDWNNGEVATARINL